MKKNKYEGWIRRYQIRAIFHNLRTPYPVQSQLAVISKSIFKLVPGKVVPVWFNKLANSAQRDYTWHQIMNAV